MKILAIRIKNLASLEGETVIDFTDGPLCTAGIFAITGPTGAGKSTILDALCLALYAETPRYNKATDPTQAIEDVAGNQITQSDPRGMLRDGTGEGFAEVDFIGVDGLRYRAQWSVRRARHRAEGTLQAYQITLKNLDDNIDEQGTKTEILAAIARKVGLSFDQFTRAVLLAQGDFTAFLKAGNNEKADLLEKLTGTHIYSEISKRIFEHHRREREELGLMQVQVQGIAVLSEEERTALLNRRTELESLLKTQRSDLDNLKKELAWFEQLTALQKSLDESQETLKTVTEQKNNAAQREASLLQVEQVQSVRSIVEANASNNSRLESKGKDLGILDAQIAELKSQADEQEALQIRAKTVLDANITRQEDAQPLLNEAKALDVKLTERGNQVEGAKNEWERAQLAVEDHNRELGKQEQKRLELDQMLKATLAFMEKHAERKPLVENHAVILSKLSQAKKILSAEQEIASRIEQNREQRKLKEAEEKNQKKSLERLQASVEKQTSELKELKNSVASVGITALRKASKESDASVEELVQSLADWKALFKAMQEHEDSKGDLKVKMKELTSLQKRLSSVDKEMETALVRKESASRALDVAKLAASQSVSSLREQLVEDEPCPVCGSEEHPYSTHNPRLNQVLIKLQEESKATSKKYEEALKEYSSLKTQVTQIQKEIKQIGHDHVVQEREIKELRKEWNRFSLLSEAAKLDTEEVEAWIKQLLTKEKSTQKRLQKQIEDWQEQKDALDEALKKIDDINQQSNATENTVKDVQRVIKSLGEQLNRDELSLNKTRIELEEIRVSVDEYFIGDWFEKWKGNAETFVQNITTFASEWQHHAETSEKAKNEQEVLAATISGLKEREAHLLLEKKKKQELLSSLEEQNANLLSERKLIFDGVSVSEVELRLKADLEEAKTAFEKVQKDLEQTRADSIRIIAQRAEVGTEVERLRNETENFVTRITHWLKEYNTKHGSALTLQELENMLAISPEWIENERKEIQQIHSAYLQAETITTERSAVLEVHVKERVSERTIEEINALLSEAQIKLLDSAREDTGAEVRLSQDAENRQKAGSLLKEIETKAKLVENWSRLNQVIGSADGKKFRQVAQEYTLEVLVGYANVQLKMLSNRYVLERIRNSLALQIVDQDMGNDKRSVNSLSGGESFLVSLALALGLASLSSSRMKVESLFIDEGFGSLDPNTLNIAMDALERLHNQGRKVGVISHVQEMTERIPVQIQVSKQNGGRSMVEVLGT